MIPPICIENLTPCVDGGRFPAKRIVGDTCVVEADIFRDGADVLRAQLRWHRERETAVYSAPMTPLSNDRWRGEFPLAEPATYFFTIEAWTDPFASWLSALRRWVEGNEDVTSEIQAGLRLLRDTLEKAPGDDQAPLRAAVERLEAAGADGDAALAVVSQPEVLALMERLGPRTDPVTRRLELAVQADRPLAACGAWYEMFPRSQGTVPGQAATLRDAEARLPAIRDLGFDVVYLPPVHPIGTTHRKGRDNALLAGPDDPGSPWAIGGPAGGHMAVEPALGTLADFDRFVEVARRLGLEVALDFAIQCSPDHPWVREHPEWFYHRPDGSIQYAENPPKRYQDVYPLNFQCADAKALWAEMLRVLEFWIDHGVKIFRVDNPHTKPFPFWQWLIAQVRRRNPEVIFLGEAFTRPKIMKTLAKLGFTQSYTYFTWRNTKAELTEYLTELSQTEMKDYLRPNFFTNTPDILHEFLQRGGRPAFAMRLILAATLSPSYGIYSGFELCENEAVPDTEEYLHSEKYEIKVRDWNRPGNLNELIARVNHIRKENPALWRLDNGQVLFYAKRSADRSNVLLIAVNLDPLHAQESMVTVPLWEIGIRTGETYEVEDLLTGNRYTWGGRNFVRLAPDALPAHILRVERPHAP
jgi:starch synthase (maltosyl-transferring)